MVGCSTKNFIFVDHESVDSDGVKACLGKFKSKFPSALSEEVADGDEDNVQYLSIILIMETTILSNYKRG